MIGNGYILLLVSTLPIFMKLLNIFNQSVRWSFYWILFVSAIILSSIFSNPPPKTHNFLFMSIIILIIKLILDNELDWQSYFIKILAIFAAINVIATLISVMTPNTMILYAKKVFSGEALEKYMDLFNSGSYPGINGQTGINGYFISLFIAYIVAEILTNPHKVLNYILLVFSIIALLLTNKRSFLLGNIIAAFILFCQNTLSEKHKGRNLIIFAAILIICLLIFKYSPAVNGVLEKMNALEKNGDITNGRSASWEETINIFKKKPFFGVGAASLEIVYGVSTHNVYLQVLAEMGIYGFITFVIFLLSSLKCSFKTYTSMVKYNLVNEKKISGMALYIQILFIIYCFSGNPLYGINFVIPYIMATSVSKSYSNFLQSAKR